MRSRDMLQFPLFGLRNRGSLCLQSGIDEAPYQFRNANASLFPHPLKRLFLLWRYEDIDAYHGRTIHTMILPVKRFFWKIFPPPLGKILQGTLSLSCIEHYPSFPHGSLRVQFQCSPPAICRPLPSLLILTSRVFRWPLSISDRKNDAPGF